jgi:hypothetical protein
MADMGKSTCASRKSPPPVSTLAWLASGQSFNASYKITHQEEITTHQEGRDYARLPGHDVSWTGHYTAPQQSMLPSSIHRNCNCISLYHWGSSHSRLRISAVRLSPWPTRCLSTSQQHCYPPAVYTAGEGPVTDAINLDN